MFSSAPSRASLFAGGDVRRAEVDAEEARLGIAPQRARRACRRARSRARSSRSPRREAAETVQRSDETEARGAQVPDEVANVRDVVDVLRAHALTIPGRNSSSSRSSPIDESGSMSDVDVLTFAHICTRPPVHEPSEVEADKKRGFIVPIGGAEDKEGDARHPAAVRRRLRRRRRAHRHHPDRVDARPTPARRYEKLFRRLGADEAKSLPLDLARGRGPAPSGSTTSRRRPASSSPAATSSASRRSSAAPPVAEAIRRANARGVAVGGTSAGAAILCEHMIAFGEEGAHAARRRRRAGARARAHQPRHHRPALPPARPPRAPAHGRSPTTRSPIGVGLDEDTAAFIDPDDVLDGGRHGRDHGRRRLRAHPLVDRRSASEGEPICMTGVRLHILTDGGDASTSRRAVAPHDRRERRRSRPMKILERRVYRGPNLYAHSR